MIADTSLRRAPTRDDEAVRTPSTARAVLRAAAVALLVLLGAALLTKEATALGGRTDVTWTREP